MPVEIERKFLVKDLSVLEGLQSRELRQGYPAPGEVAATVHLGPTAVVLQLQARGHDRLERTYEFEIESKDAQEMLALFSVDGALTELGVRLRVDGGIRGLVTLKSKAAGLSRAEYEYDIPLAHAEELLARYCSRGRLAKQRYVLALPDGRAWEIDVFEGALAGLVTAEIELSREDEHVDLPAWLGREVTHDGRYSNAALAVTQAVPAEEA